MARVYKDDDVDEFMQFKKTEKAKFFAQKAKSMGKMSDEGINMLEGNEEPFALVILERDKLGGVTGHRICVGFAGSLNDGQALAKGLENAREQLLKTLVAAKLGVDPDVVDKLGDLFDHLKGRNDD